MSLKSSPVKGRYCGGGDFRLPLPKIRPLYPLTGRELQLQKIEQEGVTVSYVTPS